MEMDIVRTQMIRNMDSDTVHVEVMVVKLKTLRILVCKIIIKLMFLEGMSFPLFILLTVKE